MRLFRPCLYVACFCALITAGATARAATAEKDAKPKKVQPLKFGEIELKGAYPEGAGASGLFGATTETLADLIGRLDKATADEKLDGVVIKINGATLGWAKVNELRQAISRLRAKGKHAIAYLDSGETHDYLVASACNQIVMPEPGELSMLGLRAEVTFYKNLLDWLHVKAEMLRVGEFKSAAEPYSRTEMSKEFRLEMDAILDDYVRQIVDCVSESRKMTGKQVLSIIDNGPYSSKLAYANGLIDRVGYEDELEGFIKAAVKDDKRPVEIVKNYGKKKSDNDFSGFAGMMKMMNLLMGGEEKKHVGSKPKVAVVHAVGMIMSGKSSASFFGGATLGSETFIKAVKQATVEKSVKAIVLRVDSPGGSALASDLMWRALQKAGKPIVVSMGDVAASGGYYISMGATHIFAEPGTLTGSIGVVGGKVAIGGLLEKVGITTSVISRGKNSGIMSMMSGFTPNERQAMQRMLDEIYQQFTRKAAEGRKMEYGKLEKLARGRVYTGAMAIKLNLVDELGTLDDAVAYAAKLGGLPAGEKTERWLLPAPVSPLESIFGSMDADAESSASLNRGMAQMLQQISPELAEALQGAWMVNLLAREPRLTLMPFHVRVH
ncbi:MAG TPA: signal peptide peptidase SppA [Planctomycetaceae bacterium]|jgi:protease-4|nr:signal peptide peptidase SppA [Planctomycetaceae bacterium]